MLQICCELPQEIKKSLTRLCFGVPNAHWVEENDLHLTLKSFPPMPASRIHDLQEKLHTLASPPLTVQLAGLELNKDSVYAIHVKTAPSPSLDQLSLKLDRLTAPYHPLIHPPHVFLGSFPKSSAARLPNYLEAFQFFYSTPFEIYSFILGDLKITSKKRIFEVDEIYPLTK